MDKLDTREVSTMLAALRLWQRLLTGESPGNDFMDIADNCGRLVPLCAHEIDELCERINGVVPPRINIKCEVRTEGLIGTTLLNVVRVEEEDDGSFTAVTDHWPNHRSECEDEGCAIYPREHGHRSVLPDDEPDWLPPMRGLVQYDDSTKTAGYASDDVFLYARRYAAAAIERLRPVTGAVAPWRGHEAAIDTKALATAQEIALMWGSDRSQFVSRIQVAVIDAMRWLDASRADDPAPYQNRVMHWMDQCFVPTLYRKMTERGDRLLEEVLELLQAHQYDPSRVATLVDYVWNRPVGVPAQEVGGVMVTLAGYCGVAGIDMAVEGERELLRIMQPEVIAKIRSKQEAKNALHFDTPLPGTPQ